MLRISSESCYMQIADSHIDRNIELFWLNTITATMLTHSLIVALFVSSFTASVAYQRTCQLILSRDKQINLNTGAIFCAHLRLAKVIYMYMYTANSKDFDLQASLKQLMTLTIAKMYTENFWPTAFTVTMLNHSFF